MLFRSLNLGNPEEFSMLELAQYIKALTGSSSEMAFHPLPEDDPRQRRPDISKAESELSWCPSVGLEEGLGRTIDYFKGILSGKRFN